MGRGIIPDGPLALPLHPNDRRLGAPASSIERHSGPMLLWIARSLILRRFGGRGLLLFGLLNFLRRRIATRRGPRGVYEPVAYQPSQGSSQIEQRRPR
jgi:hypothetical protein